jgi:alpha-L-fucosidase
METTEHKFVDFIKKKIKLHYTTINNNLAEKDNIYDRIKIFRSMYLYSNRFLKNDAIIIDNYQPNIRGFLQKSLEKSFEFIHDIRTEIVENDFTEKQIKYITMAINTIRKFKQLYYNRKTTIATILGAKLPSTDLCRKITNYLY